MAQAEFAPVATSVTGLLAAKALVEPSAKTLKIRAPKERRAPSFQLKLVLKEVVILNTTATLPCYITNALIVA